MTNKQRKYIFPVMTVVSIVIITVLAKLDLINNYFQTILTTICIKIGRAHV